MKNLWIQFFYGYVKMSIDGPYAERFLNRCIEHEITIWHIKRITKERMICYITLEDAKKIRPLLKMTSCKVSFIERKGLPFLLKKMKKRLGFTLGITSFIVILLLLSNIVWDVKIEGASPKVEYDLRQALDELGIKRGKFIYQLPNVEQIQKLVTERVEDATWIGVTLNGTTFEFEVVEQTLPEKEKLASPRHLVAKKKAIIYDLFVEKGQPMVRPNEFVNKGDLLVSGIIGREDAPQIVPAKGKVYGEIWYKSSVSIPLSNIFETLTGERKKSHYISIFQYDIPIWGFSKHTFERFEKVENDYPIRILKWTIPIQYKNVEWLEKQEITREYNKEDALKIAKEMAKEELRKKIPNDAIIKGEKVLHESVDNGKVELNIHYQVIEDIALEQPISQGD